MYDSLLTTTVQMASNINQESSSTICKKCSKLYTDPRMLPCLHSFCKKCIQSLVTQDGSKKKMIRCPTCKTATSIPEKGVGAIPQNVRLTFEAEVLSYRFILASLWLHTRMALPEDLDARSIQQLFRAAESSHLEELDDFYLVLSQTSTRVDNMKMKV